MSSTIEAEVELFFQRLARAHAEHNAEATPS